MEMILENPCGMGSSLEKVLTTSIATCSETAFNAISKQDYNSLLITLNNIKGLLADISRVKENARNTETNGGIFYLLNNGVVDMVITKKEDYLVAERFIKPLEDQLILYEEELTKIKEKAKDIKIRVLAKAHSNRVNFYAQGRVYKTEFETDPFDKRILCYLKESRIKNEGDEKEQVNHVAILFKENLSLEGTILPFAIEKYKSVL